MKKTAVILALALGFSVTSLNASNDIFLPSNDAITQNKVELSPLCKAVATGNVDVVNNLIKSGVDVNKKSNGMQPIHYAAKYNRVDMIKILITAGSTIHDPCDLGYTAVQHAKKTNAVDAENFLKRFKKQRKA